MANILFYLSVLILLITQIACGGSSPTLPPADIPGTGDDLGVAVSPQTFILSMSQGSAVTVHTAIPISLVNTASLQLNGIPVSSVGVDLQGDVVGNFDETAVKATVSPPSAIMIFTGLYKSGTPFAGSDTVKVIE